VITRRDAGQAPQNAQPIDGTASCGQPLQELRLMPHHTIAKLALNASFAQVLKHMMGHLQLFFVSQLR